MHQNASLYACLLQPGESVIHSFKTGRKGYLHLASGEIELNGIIMHGGDGARITDESEIRLSVRQAAELLLFDLM